MSRQPPSPWVVLKFGGTSVSTAERWAVIRDLLRRQLAAGRRPLVVHSALATISNRLDEMLRRAPTEDCSGALNEMAEIHLGLAAALKLDGEAILRPSFVELDQLLAGVHLLREASPRVQARVMAMGELMATRLGAAYLATQGLDVQWLDARDLLRSTPVANAHERSRYLSASCDFAADPALQKRLATVTSVALTQGFIASNEDGDTVLLGRGGSDTSGAYFAAKLAASALEVWTDVPGMFSANPKVVPGARLLRSLSYEEAQEIASTGGSVLHPRCINPCRLHGIPLKVLCTLQPELPGTLVSTRSGSDAPRVKAISGRSRITLVSMETLGMWHEVGFLADAFRAFSELGISIDLVSTSESNVTVTLDRGVNPVDSAILGKLQSRLERLCRVSIIEDVEVVSLVGQKIRAAMPDIGPALEAFAEHRIHLVSQSASDLNLSFVVEQGQANRLIQKLHGTLIKPATDDDVFGETWEELQAGRQVPPAAHTAWWQQRRSDLLKVAREHPSAYVYNLDSVRGAARRLRSLAAVDRVLFAMKANNCPGVLQALDQEGIDFECVSPGEIRHLMTVLPGLDPRRILYTPNFAPREDYEFGLKAGVWLTLDNLHPLRAWPELFAERQVFLRLDTGHGRGHHRHVRTAGTYSKFGIPLSELAEVRQLAAAARTTIVGLHAHTGSGILDPDNWHEVGRELVAVAQEFPELRYLDLGGGLGVPEQVGKPPLDLAAMDAGIAEIRKAQPRVEIWIEPGRYLVAESGVLLATVTQVKGKGQVRYVGISTGMNSLIRPALYGAFHEIANLSRLGEPAEAVVQVVGPICETGDRLGSDRLLPACNEGDVLLIGNAGAYGRVMSSDYNLRAPAPEITI
jgi:bifunctional diaminopimelate decarboxylase / aspartate kinase